MSKRLYIIFTIVGLVIFAGVVWYFQNQQPVPQETVRETLPEGNIDTPYELQVSDILENASETKAIQQYDPILAAQLGAPISEKVPLATYYTTDAEDCAALSGEDQVLCEDKLVYYDAVNEFDLVACGQLSGRLFDLCTFQIAKESDDWQNCEPITDETLEKICIDSFAISMNQPDLCEEIHPGSDEEEEHERQECIDRVAAINQGDIVDFDGDGEMNLGDIDNCNQIQTLEYFNQCVMRSGGNCEELNDATLVDQCNSIRYFSFIITADDASNCSVLPDERYSRVCELYFSNDRQFLDADNDGLSDNAELWFNTDPFSLGDDESHILEQGLPADYYDILDGNTQIDSDSDGLIDSREIELGTDPFNPDTDGDTFLDGVEVENGYDPLN